ncbi:MAG: pyruvate formate lyase family protein, partial [Lawsonibacter sp.]|nr:pyruvate formate lyase family protein [Lawsonibacter sp.]
MKTQWHNFKTGTWQTCVNVRDFIQTNYHPYESDASFLCGPTERTSHLMTKLNHLFDLEQQFGGVLDIDTGTVSSLVNYGPGYLDKDKELIVGLQTDRPLRRGVNPFGGLKMT